VATTSKVNRVEINDEGVHIVVEVEGLSAVRASQIFQATLDLAFSGTTRETGSGSILDRARAGGGPEIEEPPAFGS
jgi:hypothetical protein